MIKRLIAALIVFLMCVAFLWLGKGEAGDYYNDALVVERETRIFTESPAMPGSGIPDINGEAYIIETERNIITGEMETRIYNDMMPGLGVKDIFSPSTIIRTVEEPSWRHTN